MPSNIAFTSTALLFALSSFLPSVLADASDRDFSWGHFPDTWQDGQSGSNNCNAKWGASSPDSMCQTAVINGVDDVCLWAPPQAGPDSLIGNTERIEVAWCIKSGYGSRLIPQGTITAAQFVKTPTFVQFTAVGDFTKINVPAGDAGGELDPHGADGNGNPIGGLLYSNAWSGKYEQSHEWQSFISAGEACMRACRGQDWYNQNMCPHIYDEQGCRYNENYRYEANGGPQFESCDGDDPSGFVGHRDDGSVWTQQDGGSPPPAPAPGATSNCKAVNIQFGAAAATGNAGSSSSSSASSASTSTSSSSSSSSSASSSTTSSTTSTITSSASSTTTSTLTSTVRPTTTTNTAPTTPVIASNQGEDDSSSNSLSIHSTGAAFLGLIAVLAMMG